MARAPSDILITTPESLYLLLGSNAREHLETVDTVIVDEVHAVAGSKRGVHMALSLERLAARCDTDPQRIGLSATQRPLAETASLLGAGRDVAMVDRADPPRMDLKIVVPVPDMTRPAAVEVVPLKNKGGPLVPPRELKPDERSRCGLGRARWRRRWPGSDSGRIRRDWWSRRPCRAGSWGLSPPAKTPTEDIAGLVPLQSGLPS